MVKRPRLDCLACGLAARTGTRGGVSLGGCWVIRGGVGRMRGPQATPAVGSEAGGGLAADPAWSSRWPSVTGPLRCDEILLLRDVSVMLLGPVQILLLGAVCKSLFSHALSDTACAGALMRGHNAVVRRILYPNGIVKEGAPLASHGLGSDNVVAPWLLLVSIGSSWSLVLFGSTRPGAAHMQCWNRCVDERQIYCAVQHLAPGKKPAGLQ